MSPLTLGNSASRVPEQFDELIEFLNSRPQPAVVHYAADGSRVELSGRVLANWATKLIGLFIDECDLGSEDVVTVDMEVHWKTAAVMLAAGALGTEVQLGGSDGDSTAEQAALVVTDRPLEVIDSDSLGDAELAAVSPGMLDSSYPEATGEQIPAWVTDVSAEVRQYPDQLLEPLPAVELPPQEQSPTDGPLVLSSWGRHSYRQMLGTWAAGGVVVLFCGEPDGEMWEQMCRNEGVSPPQ